MDSSVLDASFSENFPSLVSAGGGSVLGPPPGQKPVGAWKDLLLSQNARGQSFDLSFIPPCSEEISFSENEVLEGQKDWELSLVGYAIEKRPFYGSLLAVVKKKWAFKGSFDLLSLEGDFFLFKFSCKDDFDMVLEAGPCFFFGKPFLFQRWAWDFHPKKADFSEIPIWIKLPNFPLCCWNESGFSKVASMVGVPLAVDSLTASKARISFARICVQVNISSPLPDTVSLNLNGRRISQSILYDWKPTSCEKCASFSHNNENCRLKAPLPPSARGRSRSRPPRQPAKQNLTPKQKDLMISSNNVISNSSTSSSLLPSSLLPSPLSLSNPPSILAPISDLNFVPMPSPPLEDSGVLKLSNGFEALINEPSSSFAQPPSYSITTRSVAASPAKAVIQGGLAPSSSNSLVEIDETAISLAFAPKANSKRKGKSALPP